MTLRPSLALAAIILAAPMAAQTPAPPTMAPRAAARPRPPELTAEQRTKLRAIEDNERSARRAMDDQRIAARRKHEDALRAVLTPEQFQAMHARKAAKGRGPGADGKRGGQMGARRRAGGMGAPAAPTPPRAARGRPNGG